MTFESSIEIVKHQYGKTMPMGIGGRATTTTSR